MALCEKGYTYAFMYTSRVDSFSDLRVPARPIPDGPTISKTSQCVLQMCLHLSYRLHWFVLYCDNYFSNIPHFSNLCSYRIAACGTTWPTSTAYPAQLKVDKRRANLPWGTLGGAVVNDVLAFVWQDKNLVRFLTTAFPGDLMILKWLNGDGHELYSRTGTSSPPFGAMSPVDGSLYQRPPFVTTSIWVA
jgi:hypothetical protein